MGLTVVITPSMVAVVVVAGAVHIIILIVSKESSLLTLNSWSPVGRPIILFAQDCPSSRTESPIIRNPTVQSNLGQLVKLPLALERMGGGEAWRWGTVLLSITTSLKSGLPRTPVPEGPSPEVAGLGRGGQGDPECPAKNLWVTGPRDRDCSSDNTPACVSCGPASCCICSATAQKRHCSGQK